MTLSPPVKRRLEAGNDHRHPCDDNTTATDSLTLSPAVLIKSRTSSHTQINKATAVPLFMMPYHFILPLHFAADIFGVIRGTFARKSANENHRERSLMSASSICTYPVLENIKHFPLPWRPKQ
ncbi:hypothetical protein EVAR_100091_1 [Eumeta japonica]|uniref:Uncharacterized protein n=1 Tax=Eumeta variegata TaxID=151549 RepID=A0A4C1YZI1_EUMVA|nr:hypothetical protein EVAR_100091_1 [Eumeta japonica]